ncbi:unnamed protein product [Rhodiola kirilowii]
MTPYEAVYGRSPPTMLEHIPGAITVAAVDDQVRDRTQLLQALKANLTKARHRMQQQANTRRRDKVFQIGDLVWVRLQPYRQNSLRNQRTNKLAKRFYGPFEISKRIGAVAYRLKLPPTARIHNVFHVALLRRFVGDPSHTSQALPAHFINSKPVMTPECILRVRNIKVRGSWQEQWLIKWEGLPEADASWEFKNELLAEFPDLNLEDKVVLQGGGIDGNHATGTAYVNGEITSNQEESAPEEHALPRRGARAREPSRRLPAADYVLHILLGHVS